MSESEYKYGNWCPRCCYARIGREVCRCGREHEDVTIERLQIRLDSAVTLLRDIQKDLVDRAELAGDGAKVVHLSASLWDRLDEIARPQGGHSSTAEHVASNHETTGSTPAVRSNDEQQCAELFKPAHAAWEEECERPKGHTGPHGSQAGWESAVEKPLPCDVNDWCIASRGHAGNCVPHEEPELHARASERQRPYGEVDQESYEHACRHAERGWEFLKQAVAALYDIASYREGDTVTGSFDEPASAQKAREALWELPSAGAYEGRLPGEERVSDNHWTNEEPKCSR